MCIICVEFQRNRDLEDARRMLLMARREPRSVDPEHLDRVERRLDRVAGGEGAAMDDMTDLDGMGGGEDAT